MTGQSVGSDANPLRLYAGEIIMGRITEDNVPAKLKARVHKYLVDMGYFDDVEE